MVVLQGKNALIIITGASRGIGRELATQLGRMLGSTDSTFLLLARNEQALREVKQDIVKESLSVSVELIVTDLSQPYTGSIDERIRVLEEKFAFQFRLVIHNAGSIGDVTRRASELNDESQWAAYLQTNFISMVHLNNKIHSAIGKENLYLVNITSLLSIKPFPSFTQYSVGKAAREAYFRAFAVEHPNVRVLNYSPGPVDTQMHTEVCERTYDEGVRQLFGKRYEESSELHRKLLSPTETVRRFVRVLELDKFESGARVDYFDK